MPYKQDPDKFGEFDLFRQMVKRVPAYKVFLKKYGVNYRKVTTPAGLEAVPISDKKNYIDQSKLSELCWDGKLETNTYIVNSSGSTGRPYFWPRDMNADLASGRMYRFILDGMFRLRTPTLLVNSFGQGSWIAGTEAFLAALRAHDHGLPIVAINSGIDSRLIIQQLEALAPNFTNIIILGYPPFIKDLLELIKTHKSIITKDHSVYVIVGGESISEAWRGHIEARLRPAKRTEVISIYGMSDGGGVLAMETPATRVLRQLIFSDARKPAALSRLFGGQSNTALFQYDPAERYFKSGPKGQLLIHVKYGLPLFNYDTKDNGAIVSFAEIKNLTAGKIDLPVTKNYNHYPFVYLTGRSDHAITFYALNIYPEHVRSIMDGFGDEDLTGRFILKRQDTADMQQELHIKLELTDRKFSGKTLKTKKQDICEHIFTNLPAYNSEYGKLAESISELAKPVISLCKYGSIGYKAGRKHKWVIKD